MSNVNWSPIVCDGELVLPIDQRVLKLPSKAFPYWRGTPWRS